MNADLQAVSSAAYRDIQSQKAQRDAEQAALRAERLEAAASEARREGERSVKKANELDREASQAQTEASNARQGIQAAEGFERVGEQIGEVRQQLAAPVASNEASAPAPSSPTLNLQGEVTGQNIHYVA